MEWIDISKKEDYRDEFKYEAFALLVQYSGCAYADSCHGIDNFPDGTVFFIPLPPQPLAKDQEVM